MLFAGVEVDQRPEFWVLVGTLFMVICVTVFAFVWLLGFIIRLVAKASRPERKDIGGWIPQAMPRNRPQPPPFVGGKFQ